MHISVLLFFSNLFSTDMILILIVALMLFGGDKLPEIARGLGKGSRDFKEASEGVKREINNQIYAYEEKKEEKKMEEAIKANQENPQNPGPENSVPIVENTIPFGESHSSEAVHNTENKDTEHAEVGTEHHNAAPDNGKPVV